MMRKRSTLPYYEVRGHRVGPTGDTLPVAIRFESLALYDAEQFATHVYRTEKIVCEIHEVPRLARAS